MKRNLLAVVALCLVILMAGTAMAQQGTWVYGNEGDQGGGLTGRPATTIKEFDWSYWSPCSGIHGFQIDVVWTDAGRAAYNKTPAIKSTVYTLDINLIGGTYVYTYMTDWGWNGEKIYETSNPYGGSTSQIGWGLNTVAEKWATTARSVCPQ